MYSKPYSEQSPKAIFRTITIIHFALIAGQVMFAIVASSVVTKPKKFDLNLSADPLLMIVPVMAVGSFIMSNFLFKQQLQIAAGKIDLKSKMTAYQTAMIIRLALLEGPSLFGIVVYLLTGNLFSLAVSGLIVLYFIAIRPTKDKLTTTLNLTYEEQSEL